MNHQQFFNQQQQQQTTQPTMKQFTSTTQIPGDAYLLQPINGTQQRIYRTSTQHQQQQQQQQQHQQSFQQHESKNGRSSSIPPPQRGQLYDDLSSNGYNGFSTLNTSIPGASTTRYYTTKNYTTNGEQQQQQQQFIDQNLRAASTPRHVVEMKSSQQQHNSSTTNYVPKTQYQNLNQQQQFSQQQQKSQKQNSTLSQTLPVNYNQQIHGFSTNGNNFGGGNIGSVSSSCIDYTNTHYNTDWKMRHGDIEKPIATTPLINMKNSSTPTSIPIYQQ